MGMIMSIFSFLWRSVPAITQEDSATGLSSRQKEILRKTWGAAKKADLKKVGVAFFLKFFEAHPEYQQRFKGFADVPLEELPNNRSLKSHALNVMYTISLIVDSLEDLDVLIGNLKRLGASHAKMGFTKQDFDNLAVVFADFMESALGSRFFDKEARQAWSTAFNILSRNKAAVPNFQGLAKGKNDGGEQPSLDKFIANRDFLGAVALVEYERNSGNSNSKTSQWLAYAVFHSGDFQRALRHFEELGLGNETYAAVCLFFLGLYEESLQVLNKTKTEDPLKTRLLFHLAHKLGDEDKVLQLHAKLKDIVEDQLSLAAVHFLRAHYQEAIDIYKRLLSEHREFTALQVYIALCYYKLDYYDVSQEVVSIYLQKNPDSLIAANLRACNTYRLYNGRAAENELKPIMDISHQSYGRDLLQHNLVVFRQGEGALQILPKLVDSIPEARLNLVIYYMKQDDVNGASRLLEQIQPTLPNEYILKGIVNAVLAQETGIKEYMDIAQQYLQLVGSSSSECDTIPGRQCMASALFLQRQFEESHLYFNSIKSYFLNDDTFNYNFGQVLTYLGQYKEAESVLARVQSEKLRTELTFLSCLTRSLVMNHKAQQAWDLYKRLDTSAESLGVLHLLANDAYRTGQFLVAARSFELLWKFDPSPENSQARLAACAGHFQMIIAGRQPSDTLNELLAIFANSVNETTVEFLLKVNTKFHSILKVFFLIFFLCSVYTKELFELFLTGSRRKSNGGGRQEFFSAFPFSPWLYLAKRNQYFHLAGKFPEKGENRV
nr:EOG090X04LA [Eulimnadia texana]